MRRHKAENPNASLNVRYRGATEQQEFNSLDMYMSGDLFGATAVQLGAIDKLKVQQWLTF